MTSSSVKTRRNLYDKLYKLFHKCITAFTVYSTLFIIGDDYFCFVFCLRPTHKHTQYASLVVRTTKQHCPTFNVHVLVVITLNSHIQIHGSVTPHKHTHTHMGGRERERERGRKGAREWGITRAKERELVSANPYTCLMNTSAWHITPYTGINRSVDRAHQSNHNKRPHPTGLTCAVLRLYRPQRCHHHHHCRHHPFLVVQLVVSSVVVSLQEVG